MMNKSLAYVATALAVSPFSSDPLNATSFEVSDVENVKKDASTAVTLQNIPIRMSRPDILGARIEIKGSNSYIPVLNAPDLLIDNGNVVVDRWGTIVPLRSTLADDIRNQVVHDFRLFAMRAEQDRLSDDDMNRYEAILNDIDYGLYCELNAPLVYKEARVLRKGKRSVTIQWHQGEDGIERVKGPMADAFGCIHANERFSAEVLFVDGRIRMAHNVTPLDDVDA